MTATSPAKGVETGFTWVFAGVTALMAVSLVVDWRSGKGFDWSTSALLLMLGSQAVRDVLQIRGMERAAARTGTVGNWLLVPAAAMLWAEVIIGWNKGKGTSWLPLTAAVALSLGAVAAGVIALRRRRKA